MTSFRVGFSVPEGEEVRIDARHLGITGLTQESGKTTALEAFMERANETAIAFRTSRGELGFHGAKRIAPYFRERTDWRFVEGLISAHLMEHAKIYRSDLMRLTRGTHGLSEVHANIRTAMAKARPGSWPEKILTELNEYLVEIRDALESVRFDSAPNLTPTALSVMDLEGLSPSVQQLVIAATVDWLMEGHLTGPVIVVLPEARDFIPEDRRTPAKLALENLIRKGARVDRYLWLDSQALTGLDMDVCRSIGTWFFGRQTLDLEIRRVGKMVPGRRVKPDEVRGLCLGTFLMVQGEAVRCVYVQPAWLDDHHAMRAAQGIDRPEEMDRLFKPKHKERNVDEKKEQQYKERIAAQDDEIKRLTTRVSQLAKSLETEHDRAEANARTAALNAAETIAKSPSFMEVAKGLSGEAEIRAKFPHTPSAREGDGSRSYVRVDPDSPVPVQGEFGVTGAGDRERIDLHVDRDTPSLTVHARVVTVDAQQDTPRGKLALLIADGFFDTPRKQADVAGELKARGWGAYSGGNSRVVLYKNLQEMTGYGFFRYDGSNYAVVPEARERIRVVREKVAA